MPFDVVLSGQFDLGGVLATVRAKAKAMGARRVVFDVVDVLLALVDDPAAERGERALYVGFDEEAGEMVRNLKSVHVDLAPHLESGLLHIHTAYAGVRGTEAAKQCCPTFLILSLRRSRWARGRGWDCPRCTALSASVEESIPEMPEATDGGRWVLVVEDEEAARVTLVESLSALGYETLGAENGAAALAICRDQAQTVLCERP